MLHAQGNNQGISYLPCAQGCSENRKGNLFQQKKNDSDWWQKELDAQAGTLSSE